MLPPQHANLLLFTNSWCSAVDDHVEVTASLRVIDRIRFSSRRLAIRRDGFWSRLDTVSTVLMVPEVRKSHVGRLPETI